jgi:hypothetical protein
MKREKKKEMMEKERPPPLDPFANPEARKSELGYRRPLTSL